MGRTAGPSTALRSGRDDKGRGWLRLESLRDGEKPQVPPLRFAPVGGCDFLLPRKDWREPQGALQIPPLRSPGFPVENRGVDLFRAALFKESRIRGRCWHCEVGNPGPLRSG